MRHTRVLITLTAAIGMVAGTASTASAATTYFVNRGSAACSNTGPGTEAQPFCTISAAAARTAAGDTVRVAAGTYNEQVTETTSGTSAARITYVGASGAVVTGAANGFRLSGRAYVTIRGFTVRDTTAAGFQISNSNNITLDGNEVSGAGAPVVGQQSRGITLQTTINSVVRNNRTHHNSDAGIGLTSGSTGNTVTSNESFNNARETVRAAAGIDLRNSGSNVVSFNRLHDNEDSGLNIWDSSNGSRAINNVVWSNGDHGIDVHNTNDARVVANTVHKNADSGIEMTTSLRTALRNNISTDNGINSARTSGQLRADATSAPSTTTDYDLLFLSVAPGGRTVFVDWGGTKYTTLQAYRTATGQEAHGVSGDPLFVASPGNLRLNAGSPAIGKANATTGGQPSVDADGKPRTIPMDIGAFETS